jgi:hypothetical protein
LIEDIYALLAKPNRDMEFDPEKDLELGLRLVQHIRDEVKDPDRSDRDPNTVYVTNITSNCPRRRWYEFHHVEKGIKKEKIQGQNRFKFVYGDVIEELVLHFAELAGHTVTRRQERLTVPMAVNAKNYTLAGRIDAIIDDVLVDVKSMEGYTFDKFAKGEYDDKWGYGNQLYVYETMLKEQVKERMILGINKLNGRMHIAHLPHDPSFHVGQAIKDAVHPKPTFADRQVTTTNGVKSLDTLCAYCPFKVDCYKELGGLQVYAYASGPRFVLKDGAKPPKVPEITEAWFKETFDE